MSGVSMAGSSYVRVTKDEAYNLQMKFISDWEPQADTWFLRFGALVLAGVTAAGSIMITAHYRTRLKLRSKGQVASYLPLSFIPAITAGMSHHAFVTQDLVVLNTPCPVCLSLRSIAVQLAVSIAMPVAMATISNFHIAQQWFTYPLPALSEDPRGLLKTWRKLSRPLARPLALLAAANIITAAGVTHMEMSQLCDILEKADQRDAEARTAASGTAVAAAR